MLNNLLKKIRENKSQVFVLVSLLAIAGIAHGYNMFSYPYYENDEGTYMSQAWSLLARGELAPYTYWYDHAPGGWILIAIWVKLTGGFFTFGTSVNSGRVLMLLLHLASSALLYFIAKRLSKNTYTATIAVFVFSLSPLGIYFQRRVLLDNIMTFWVLLSLAFVIRKKLKLIDILISSIAFGIAILTKENAIFFAPAFIYLIWTKANKTNKSFSLSMWIVMAGSITSLYFLYALLKGELLPTGFLGDTTERVSLLDTLRLQFSRGRGLPFWDEQSDFFLNFSDWLRKDFLTMLLGLACTFLAILMSYRHKSARVLSIFVVLFFIFLMRGKTVIDFYIVPIIPFLGLVIGLSTPILAGYIQKYLKISSKVFLSIFSIVILFGLLFMSRNAFYLNETAPQIATVNWIKDNLEEDDFIVIDCYSYVDLHEARFTGDKKFVNADWFWKLQSDPEIRDDKYENDWRKIEYIALSHEMLKQTKQDNTQNFLDVALDNSYQIVDWTKDRNSYLDLENHITTNGDWMSIYKVKDENQILLDSTWKYYKDNFVHNYGQVIDPLNNRTTSEGQSYAMLRAVWANDRETFDGVYLWARDHLAHRIQDNLYSWRWENNQLIDSATASDADEDIALALLFGYKKWGDQKYYSDALRVISDIWRQEVIEVNGRYYLTLGAGIEQGASYLVNPSYLSPATYRIFADADPFHEWDKLADDSYRLLNEIATLPGNNTSLPPDWVTINSETGNISVAENGPNYGFDAFRTMCRVAQDYMWFSSRDAYDYLALTEPFFRAEFENNKRVFGVYGLDGAPLVDYESLSPTSGALCNFEVTNRYLADELYRSKFEAQLNGNEYWGDRNNYYDQNWAWFATAMHTGNMVNLWNK